MAMKRLIVCCDGTWNDADNGTGYTNVSRLAWAIQPVDTRDGKEIPQIVFYQSGVGTRGRSLQPGRGRRAGARPVAEPARRLHVHLQQLSRGRRDLPVRLLARRLHGAQHRRPDRLRGAARQAGSRSLPGAVERLQGARQEPRPAEELPEPPRQRAASNASASGTRSVRSASRRTSPCSIPSSASTTDSSTPTLGAHVEHAFHALALDERRKNFVPTLWTQKPGVEKPGAQAGLVCRRSFRRRRRLSGARHVGHSARLDGERGRAVSRHRFRLPEGAARPVGKWALGMLHEVRSRSSGSSSARSAGHRSPPTPGHRSRRFTPASRRASRAAVSAPTAKPMPAKPEGCRPRGAQCRAFGAGNGAALEGRRSDEAGRPAGQEGVLVPRLLRQGDRRQADHSSQIFLRSGVTKLCSSSRS